MNSTFLTYTTKSQEQNKVTGVNLSFLVLDAVNNEASKNDIRIYMGQQSFVCDHGHGGTK